MELFYIKYYQLVLAVLELHLLSKLFLSGGNRRDICGSVSRVLFREQSVIRANSLGNRDLESRYFFDELALRLPVCLCSNSERDDDENLGMFR